MALDPRCARYDPSVTSGLQDVLAGFSSHYTQEMERLGKLKGRIAAIAGAVLLLGAQGCTSDGSASGDSAAGPPTRQMCEARLLYGGEGYYGLSGLVRDPELTGRTVPVTLKGCADRGTTPGEDVSTEAAVLRGVPPTSVLLQGTTVYVRDGRKLPPQARRWFTEALCNRARPFDVGGGELNSEGADREDRDSQTPYRLLIHVDSGPSEYVGSRLKVRVEKSTELLPKGTTVDDLLREGRAKAQLRCHNGYFEALSVSLPRGG